MKAAILVDGAFFIRRARKLLGPRSPVDLAKAMCAHLQKHMHYKEGEPQFFLYRIFFYDCPPFAKKLEHPLTRVLINFGASERAQWRREFHDALRRSPKVALRLGVLDDKNFGWAVEDRKLKKLCRKEIGLDDLEENDIRPTFKQKGVDMRIGLDIASIAFKKQADRIVLVSGDSDFVPAAKLARREGIEFVLDPMWASIRSDLNEHIDLLRSVFPQPAAASEPV